MKIKNNILPDRYIIKVNSGKEIDFVGNYFINKNNIDHDEYKNYFSDFWQYCFVSDKYKYGWNVFSKITEELQCYQVYEFDIWRMIIEGKVCKQENYCKELIKVLKRLKIR